MNLLNRAVLFEETRENSVRRMEGIAFNSLVRIAKLNFRLIVSHFATALHSHVYMCTIHQPQARYATAREPDDKSEVRPLVF